MPVFEIKHRWNGSVLFSLECGSFEIAFQAYIQAQVAAGAKCGPVRVSCEDLTGVNFVGSRFVGSRFEGSRFEGSRFEDSSFVDSSFVGSSFVDSSFVGSSFVGSRFVGSSFVGSSFVGSSFLGSSFVGSSFVGSRFVGSRFVGSRFEDSSFDNQAITLFGIDFSSAREDMKTKLSIVSEEVPALRLALIEGRINGRVYEGECCCFVGTIAKEKKCKYTEIEGLRPNGGSPVELFFLSIAKGDTPGNSHFAKLAVQWIDEWAEKNQSAAAV